MPHPTDILEKRLDAIRAFVSRRRVASQRQIVEHLLERGFEVTQASVSRDLGRLGVAKLDGRYVLPAEDKGETAGEASAPSPFLLLLDVREAGPNLTIIETPPGAASTLGVHLDRQHWPELVGTVAGDDTLFAATRNRADQKSLIMRIKRSIPMRGQ